MGIAVHRSFLTYVATVVEVEVDDQGEVKIPVVHTAVDAGLVVNPEATRSQFEGAAVFGTSIVRSGEITAKDGVIEQSNFDNYPVARMNEAPYKTNVYIVDSDAPPAGWASRECRRLRRRSAMPFLPPPENEIRELPLSRGWPGPRAASRSISNQESTGKALIAMSVNRRRPGFSQPLLL